MSFALRCSRIRTKSLCEFVFRQHEDLFPETLHSSQEQFSLLLLPPSETAQLVGNATVSKDPKIPFQMFDSHDNIQHQ